MFRILVTLCLPLIVTGLVVRAPEATLWPAPNLCRSVPSNATIVYATHNPLRCLRGTLPFSRMSIHAIFNQSSNPFSVAELEDPSAQALDRIVPMIEGDDAEAMKVVDMLRATARRLEQFKNYSSMTTFQSDLEKDITDLKLKSEYMKAADGDADGQVSQKEVRVYLFAVFAMSNHAGGSVIVNSAKTVEQLDNWPSYGMIAWMAQVDDAQVDDDDDDDDEDDDDDDSV